MKSKRCRVVMPYPDLEWEGQCELPEGHEGQHKVTPPQLLPTSSEQRAEVPVLVRMPADLHEAVKAAATIEERSMAQTIRYALRQYLEARSKP